MKFFIGKIISYSFYYFYVQHFMDKDSLKLIFLNDFYNCNVVSTLLQIKNVLQLIIELFIFAPISQHNGKSPLIINFHEKNLKFIYYNAPNFDNLRN
jgi:hypothetical protein